MKRKLLLLLSAIPFVSGMAQVPLPLDAEFCNGATMDGYTVVDANNDGITWAPKESGIIAIKYSLVRANDDWFITPGIALQAGMVYDMMYVAHSAGTKYTETFEISLGTFPTADGMQISLLPPTEFNMKRLERHLHFTPPTDGIYYIGFHAMSPRDQLGAEIEEIHITTPQEGRVPEGVSGLTVTPDMNGLRKAEVMFVAPTETYSGTPLSALTEIRVLRNGEVVKTYTNPTPGEEIKYIDEPPVAGEYVYGVTTTNSYGDGPTITAKYEYVGHERPEVPFDGRAVETQNRGEVYVSWDAVTKDVLERPLTADDVTYTVEQIVSLQGKFTDKTVVAEGIHDNFVTTRVVDADQEQAMVKYKIRGVTEGGAGKEFTTLSVAAGKPYTAPVKESVANGLTTYNWGSDAWVGDYSFHPMFDSQIDDIKSVDGDGGYFMMMGDDYWDTAFLTSGKIDLRNLEKPMLSFYGLVVPTNLNTVTVFVDCGDGFTQEGEFVMNCEGAEGEGGGWQRFELNLDKYKGKTITVRFKGVLIVMSYVALDCIEIYNLSDNDLAISRLAAPVAVKAGERGQIDVTVENRGINPASGYSLNLYRDGSLLDSVSTLPTIEPKQSYVHTFYIDVAPVESGTVSLKAEVTLDGDENQADNYKETSFDINTPATPAPRELNGRGEQDGSVTLSWIEPDCSGEPVASTEDFEQYDDFIIDGIGQWTLIDADGSNSCGWGDYTTHIPHLYNESFAYMVMNQTVLDPNSSLYGHFTSHSGDKYLVAANNFDRSADKDDWLISPRLNGDAQTVSFFARGQFSYRTETGECFEQFEFLISKSGKEMDDFEKIDFKDLVPKTWTKYEFAIPAGTNYFAVRATSHDAFWFLMDDFTFISLDDDPSKLQLLGYNVYDNGRKVNDIPVTETQYRIATPAAGHHRYNVSALYAQCESGGSNTFEYDPAGIGLTDLASIRIFAENGDIVVCGADGENIYISDAAGMAVASRVCDGVQRFSLAPGLYLVRVGGKTAKILL